MAAKLRAHQVDVDPDFAPQSRPRSCTWPLPQPDLAGDEDGALGAGVAEGSEDCGPERRATAPAMAPAPPLGAEVGPLRKAKSSRRNAWGNLSYADLITKAIESAPDKRLTLSQIYDWMVRYVPYFKDKGDSNSSAGWKNSIRHNLSLHTRFIRVQNEGTGKSSWWMLNPEGGKTGKTPRRRAVSMDNGAKFLRIKGKASKKKQLHLPERSPDDSPPGAPVPGPLSASAKWAASPASHASDDYEAWADFRGSRRPLLGEAAELEDDEALEALAPSSPLMYPSPASALSPALGARCPGELPRLASCWMRCPGPTRPQQPGLWVQGRTASRRIWTSTCLAGASSVTSSPSSSTTSWTVTKWTSTSTQPCLRHPRAWLGRRPLTRAGCRAEGHPTQPGCPGPVPMGPLSSHPDPRVPTPPTQLHGRIQEATPAQLETSLRAERRGRLEGALRHLAIPARGLEVWEGWLKSG